MPTTPLDAVRELLKRDSVLGNRAQETISYVMDLLFYGDFQIVEQVASTDDFDFINLIGIRGHETGEKPLWLVSNLSTGSLPVPNTWTETGGNPFAPTIDEEHGILYGLGASSGKVDLVLKLLAASHFLTEELTRPIYFVAMVGDEGRSSGIRSLLSLARASGGYALVGAPSNLSLWSEHPGCVVVELKIERRVRHRRMPTARGFFHIDITGESAHAQLPALGQDAIQEAIQLIDNLREHTELRVLSFQGGTDAITVPGACTICIATSSETLPDLPPGVSARPLSDGDTVPFPIDPMLRAWLDASDEIKTVLDGQLQSADWKNLEQPPVVSHLGTLRSDRDSLAGTLIFWHPQGIHAGELSDQVEALLHQSLAGKEELEGSVRVIQDRPPLQTPQEGSFQQAAVHALEESGLNPVWSNGYVTTDAGFLSEAGVETLAFGAGNGVQHLYRDNENIAIDQLEASHRFYKKIIEHFCVKKP